MKKKSLLLIVSLSFFLIMSSLSPTAYAAEEEPDSYYIGEATITCSSGTTGRCFEVHCDYYSQDGLVKYICNWTGYQGNYCPLLVVKICNILVGNIL